MKHRTLNLTSDLLQFEKESSPSNHFACIEIAIMKRDAVLLKKK